MTLAEKIEALVALGEYIINPTEKFKAVINYSYLKNNWFTKANTKLSLEAFSKEYLQKEKLEKWAANYAISNATVPKNVGIVMAGNIPAVGFQDLLCTFVSGHRSFIKLSEKDKYLIPHFIEFLTENFPKTIPYFKVVPRLTGIDAVIATGSNNSARYFETYFKKYPHLIRKNRNSVGILRGTETDEQLARLGNDVFQFFGLGCRNVSKVYVPKGYDFQPLLEALHEFRELVHHNKYKNNFDYNYTMLIINKIYHQSTGAILLTEDKALTSRIAQLHYEFYEEETALIEELENRKEEIQCIVSDAPIGTLKVNPLWKSTSSDFDRLS